MNDLNLSVATMTWARDAAEERVLRSSIESLAELRLPTFVTDGGSDANFVKFLRSFKNFYVFEAKSVGVVKQIKISLLAARQQGAKFIFYSEPDKKEFFERETRRFVAHAFSGERPAGVTLAARSEESLKTFPAPQYYTESVMNRLCGEQVDVDTDFCYGPVIFDGALIQFLENIDREIGWGWRFCLFVIASRLNLPLKSYVADLACPQDQRANGERERILRLQQLSQNIQGLILGLNLSLSRMSGSSSEHFQS